MQIKLILTDLDGTLVDTREANFLAYREVLEEVGYLLTRKKYNDIFGLRFEEFMTSLGIPDGEIRKRVKELKAEAYPNYFNHLNLNKSLFEFIEAFHASGGKTGLISTAQRNNIESVLRYLEIRDTFDIIVSGDEVTAAKPRPDAYLYAMEQMKCEPAATLIFEDSDRGIEAASQSGANHIRINDAFLFH